MSRQRQATESGLEPMDYTELHEEIDRLPEKYRRPIILCYMQGRTHSQAAEALGWPMGTVQVRLHRGRERLRSRLTRRGFGLIGLTMTDLETSLSATTDAPGREWTETTARAAIRFASGQGTSGLVAPVVIGWAEWALTAVFKTMLKIVALTTIALVLGWVGVSAIGPSNDGTVSIPGATRTTGDRIEPVPTPQAALRETGVHKDDRAPIRPVPRSERNRMGHSPRPSRCRTRPSITSRLEVALLTGPIPEPGHGGSPVGEDAEPRTRAVREDLGER